MVKPVKKEGFFVILRQNEQKQKKTLCGIVQYFG